MNPRVVSVQVGRALERGTPGASDVMDRPWRSGIFKQAVDGRVHVGPLGVDGDEQADLVNHGGPDKAMLIYSAENLAAWSDVLGEVPPGGFGENPSRRRRVARLWPRRNQEAAAVGVRQPNGRVSDSRRACCDGCRYGTKLDRRWRRRDLGARVIQTGRSGWYVRVLEPGAVGAGDAVDLVERPHPGWTVARAARIMHGVDRDDAAAAELAALARLAPSWSDALRARRL